MRLVPPVFEAIFGAADRRGQPAARQVAPPAAGGRPWRRHVGVKFIALLEVDGEPRGYAIYRVKNDWDDRGPKSVLTVMEVTGLDVAAERALWEWLAGIDLVRTSSPGASPSRRRCSSSSRTHDGSG